MKELVRDRLDKDLLDPPYAVGVAARSARDDALPIDYKDPQSLRYFVSERGKIVPRRISGCCAKHQRAVQLAVKHSRNIALLPFTSND